MSRNEPDDIEVTVSLPPFSPAPLPTSSTPPTSSKRPSIAARALQSKPGKLTTQVITGLTIASGVVSLGSTISKAVGHEQSVTVFAQLSELLQFFGKLFGG